MRRRTEVETGAAEGMKQRKKKKEGKEHQRTEDDVIQEILRENSRQPQEPSPCCVSISHILEGVCTKNHARV